MPQNPQPKPIPPKSSTTKPKEETETVWEKGLREQKLI